MGSVSVQGCLGVGVMHIVWVYPDGKGVYLSECVLDLCLSKCLCWCLQVAVQAHLWHVSAGQYGVVLQGLSLSVEALDPGDRNW